MTSRRWGDSAHRGTPFGSPSWVLRNRQTSAPAVDPHAPRPTAKRFLTPFLLQTDKAKAALAVLDAEAKQFNDPPLMGEIAVACALGYMEFRDVIPDWRSTYPKLAGWYARILERPSFVQTAPD